MEKSNKRKGLAIYSWTTKRYIPISIAYWVLLFLSLPTIQTFTLIIATTDKETKLFDYTDIMKDPSGFVVLPILVAVLFSTILSFIAFSYMHNKRCVDFFGSLPVSRRTMFFARYLGVVTLVAVPLVIVGILGGAMTLTMTGFLTMMKYMLLTLLSLIGNVTFIAFISLCCGTIADVIISFLSLNAAYPIFILICSQFPASVIPGMASDILPASVYTFLAPLIAPLTGVFGENKILYIIWWIAILAVALVGCFILCKRRKSETAQNSSTFSVLSFLVKFIVCFVAGFALGWMLSYIGNVGQTIVAQYIWFYVGAVIGILTSNILLHLVFYKGLVNFQKSLIGCVVILVAVSGFLFSTTTGMFGYDNYVPKEKDVASIFIGDTENSFIADGKDILKVYSDKQKDIKDIKKVHQLIVDEEVKSLYPIVEMDMVDTESEIVEEDFYSDYEDVEVCYKLKNGKVVRRIYDISELKNLKEVELGDVLNRCFPSRIDLASIPEKYLEQDIVITKMKESKCFRQSYGDSVDEDSANEDYVHISKENVSKLIAAIREDYKEHGAISSVVYDHENVYTKKDAPKILEDTYKFEISYYSDDDILSVDWAIDKTYHRAMAVMKQLNLTNLDYYQIKKYCDESQDSKGHHVKKTDERKTIYFTMPINWDSSVEVRAMSYNPKGNVLYDKLDSEVSKCTKVSENVWKYEMPANSDWTSLMFYQMFNERMNYTGCIHLPKNERENFLNLKKRKTYITRDDFPSPLYKYEWSVYKK